MTYREETLAEGVTLYCGDCREILPTLPKHDACICDPPYGNRHSGDSSRFSGGQTRRGKGSSHGRIVGDGEPFNPAHIIKIADAAIIWGFNYFPQHLSPGSLLVWSKRRPAAYGTFLGDGEVAWFSKGTGVYLFEHIFAGSSAAVEYSGDAYAPSAHPFQKPIAVMEWCIKKIPDAKSIIDPYCGSGSTGVAAVKLGRRFTGIEIDERYFDVACRRICDALKQPDFLIEQPKPAPAKQESFDV